MSYVSSQIHVYIKKISTWFSAIWILRIFYPPTSLQGGISSVLKCLKEEWEAVGGGGKKPTFIFACTWLHLQESKVRLWMIQYPLSFLFSFRINHICCFSFVQKITTIRYEWKSTKLWLDQPVIPWHQLEWKELASFKKMCSSTWYPIMS